MIMIAGPCAVESVSDTHQIAKELSNYSKEIILRGGCWKPRTKPDSFQGLGEAGVEILVEAYEANGLAGCCLEVMDKEHLAYIAYRYPEKNIMLQIGSRNMQNFELLKLVGAFAKDMNVILCERGIRTLSDASRFTLDLSAIPVLQQKTGCAVIVDPSHAAGQRDLVPGLARAGIAAGADGLEIEVRAMFDNCKRQCDDAQALPTDEFYKLVYDCQKIDNLIRK